MKSKELREKNIVELEKLVSEKRGNILKFRFDIAAKQVKDNRQIRNDKRDIARILTIIEEKKSQE